MASKILTQIKKDADRLWILRRTIDELQEEKQAKIDYLKQQKEEIEVRLIAQLKAAELPSIKTKEGVTMTVYQTKGLEVTNEPFALKWAIENRAVSINKILAKQILKDAPEIPSCFAVVEKDSIRITVKK